MTEKHETYENEEIFGQVAPSLEGLDFVRGDKIDLAPGVVHVLYFYTGFYKGGFAVNDQIKQLEEKHTSAQFITVSCDADKETVLKFLGKIADGKTADVNTGHVYGLSSVVAFDDKKRYAKMMATLSAAAVLHMPQAFIVDKNGRVAWKQTFSQSHDVSATDFEQQLQCVLKGETPKSVHGPKPKVVIEEEDAECDEEMSLF